MKNTTLLFLLKREEGNIKEILLAMKKRGFGSGRYNGVGGKVENLETIEQAVLREAKEEIGVDVKELDLIKNGEINFSFENKSEWNQTVHIFTTEIWSEEIVESEEMKPEWYHVDDIPFDQMWPDDKYWFPLLLEGKKFKGKFVLEGQDKILEHKLELI